MNDIVLKVEGLTKSYGDLVAVNNISFEVRKGEFFAFLGRNGAGKSTTIKMLTTLLKQDAGSFYLDDNSSDEFIRENIGVVFQENMLDKFLTVKENLMVRAKLTKMKKADAEKRFSQLVKQFGLKDFLNKQARFLSGGQARRAEIARALFTRPKVLFLDEPTAGLDSESRKILWEILKELQNENKTTIFLTTHYMEETNNADYVVIINKGEILAKGTPAELKDKYSKDYFKVFPKDENEFEKYLKTKKLRFEKVVDNYIVKTKGTDEIIKTLSDNSKNIVHFEVVKGTMDDVFIEVVKDEVNDSENIVVNSSKVKTKNTNTKKPTKNNANSSDKKLTKTKQSKNAAAKKGSAKPIKNKEAIAKNNTQKNTKVKNAKIKGESNE